MIEIAVVLFPIPCLFAQQLIFAMQKLPPDRTRRLELPAKRPFAPACRAEKTCLNCVKDGNFSENAFCVNGLSAEMPRLPIKRIYSRRGFNSVPKHRVQSNQINAAS
jgi:hypothetical protein